MPLSCPAVTTPITTANYMEAYTPPSGIRAALPPDSTTIIESDGKVNNVNVNNYAILIMTYASPPSGINPTTNSNLDNEAALYSGRAKALRDSINAEYCWYYNRYIWALTQLLMTAGQSGTVVSSSMKDNVATLNNKLNKILLVMKAVINSRLNQLNTYYTNDVNSQNSALDLARQRLRDNSEILRNNDLNADVKSAMIEYSLEKNTTSRNLMAVYGFMNIVAVGLLFYLYTHSKE